MLYKNKSPLARQGATRANINSFKSNFNKKHPYQLDDSLLPDPKTYYRYYFPKMKINKKWVLVKCPFHADSTPSLSISLIHGGFKCFGCGAKGALIKFHMMYHKMKFTDVVTQFGAWSHD